MSFQIPPPKRSRPHRTAIEENRRFVKCPFCSKEYYAQVCRHLLTHKEVKSRKEAKAIYKGLQKYEKDSQKKPVNEVMDEIWGNLLEDPEIRAKVKKTCLVGGLKFDVGRPTPEESTRPTSQEQADASSSDSSESDEEDNRDEDSATVRQRKKDLNLHLRVPGDHQVIIEFEAALKKHSKSEDNVRKTVDRVASFLAFAELQHPSAQGYMAVVNIKASKEYMSLNKKAGVANATRLTYAKSMATLLQLMKTRQRKMPSVPWESAGYEDKYNEAVIFWQDYRRKTGRKTLKDRDEKLAKGEEVIADLGACYAYLDDPIVRQKFNANMERIRAFARVRSPLTFGRGDVHEVLAYNSVVRYVMMNIIIRNGGMRTGTVQNLRLQEVAGAADDGVGNRIIQISRHKNDNDGNASFVLSNQDYAHLTELIAIREKIRCDKGNKTRVFVTTQGKKFPTHSKEINTWMATRNLPKITTNSIRKAVETAAASHSLEAQKMVANRLNHSLQTADNNYRAQTTSTIMREFEALQNVVNNERAIKHIRENKDILFAGMETFPNVQDLSAILAQELGIAGLELSEEAVKRARRAFEEREISSP